jgi:hypothetical protein
MILIRPTFELKCYHVIYFYSLLITRIYTPQVSLQFTTNTSQNFAIYRQKRFEQYPAAVCLLTPFSCTTYTTIVVSFNIDKTLFSIKQGLESTEVALHNISSLFYAYTDITGISQTEEASYNTRIPYCI